MPIPPLLCYILPFCFLLFPSFSVLYFSPFISTYSSTFSCPPPPLPPPPPPPPGMVVLSQLGCGLEGSGSSLPSPRLQQQHQPQIQVMQQLWHYPSHRHLNIRLSAFRCSSLAVCWYSFYILLRDTNSKQPLMIVILHVHLAQHWQYRQALFICFLAFNNNMKSWLKRAQVLYLRCLCIHCLECLTLDSLQHLLLWFTKTPLTSLQFPFGFLF